MYCYNLRVISIHLVYFNADTNNILFYFYRPYNPCVIFVVYLSYMSMIYLFISTLTYTIYVFLLCFISYVIAFVFAFSFNNDTFDVCGPYSPGPGGRWCCGARPEAAAIEPNISLSLYIYIYIYIYTLISYTCIYIYIYIVFSTRSSCGSCLSTEA